ncbi:hypothetical protein BJY04DRAFT_187517 [Aspergillus karnatakaensis]|uniref:uncharacterized protein n=1 Tax=Aspergillus karnatakaensis TaxID=1810916 RepID=UPI003CCD74B7
MQHPQNPLAQGVILIKVWPWLHIALLILGTAIGENTLIPTVILLGTSWFSNPRLRAEESNVI